MKIRYFAGTGTLFIEFRDVAIAETRDLDENTLLDVDVNGDVCECLRHNDRARIAAG
jgi:uncharacterized protein YuzE